MKFDRTKTSAQPWMCNTANVVIVQSVSLFKNILGLLSGLYFINMLFFFGTFGCFQT